MNPTVEQKKKFLEVFKVQVHAMASQTLVYNEEKDDLIYQNTEVFGGTDKVVLDVWGGAEIIEIEDGNEHQLIHKWAMMFAECNEDIEAFIEMVENNEDGEEY